MIVNMIANGYKKEDILKFTGISENEFEKIMN